MVNKNIRYNLILSLLAVLVPVLLATWSQASAAQSAACGGCAELLKIVAAYKSGKAKSAVDLNELQLQATDAIDNLPLHNGKLNSAQVKAVVQIFRVAAPPDPSQAIFVNSVELIKNNRQALEAELKKLSPAEAKDLLLSLRIALEEQSYGNEDHKGSQAPPKNQPKKK